MPYLWVCLPFKIRVTLRIQQFTLNFVFTEVFFNRIMLHLYHGRVTLFPRLGHPWVYFSCYLRAFPQISSVQLLSHVQFFVTPWMAARQASMSITNSWSLLKLMSIESGMPSNYLIHCHPLSSHFQPFPASGSFQMSQLFALGGQSIGVSVPASVFPVNIQDWFPLGWTSWISLQSKGISSLLQHHSSKTSILQS